MTSEADLMAWIAEKWPTLLMAMMLGKAYLKVRQFPVRLAKAERQIDRLMQVCAKQHGDQALFLLRDGEEKEE